MIFHSDDWTAIPFSLMWTGFFVFWEAEVLGVWAETGTLWFGPKYTVVAAKGRKTRNISRFSVGDVPVFADIDDVNAVYQLIMDLRDKNVGASIAGLRVTYNS